MCDEDNSEIMDVESNEDHEDIEEEDEEEEEEEKNVKPQVYLPGQLLKKGEELVVDKSAYRLLHEAQSGAPCLSFDVVNDDLGNERQEYPLTMYLVAGTQAARAHINNILVMKLNNLNSINEDSDSDDCSDSDDEDPKPIMAVKSIQHQGCVNRIRCNRIGDKTLVASWSELGRVSIWNISEQLQALEKNEPSRGDGKKSTNRDENMKPLYTFKGHLAEGYALDWCPTEPGMLASGDCKGNIHVWRNINGAEWHVDQRAFNSHAPHSVEDLQWSPSEKPILASCSVDKSIKIWDTRSSPQAACMLSAAGAHDLDINVLSWNRRETKFLLSGGDDGLVCVWDLKYFKSPVAIFKQHTAPVTTVEWDPNESTVFASGGADDQIIQWDLALEKDDTGEPSEEELQSLPPQLLFIHQGQTDIKELHWHPQCTGTIISTAHSGFNIFRTISV